MAKIDEDLGFNVDPGFIIFILGAYILVGTVLWTSSPVALTVSVFGYLIMVQQYSFVGWVLALFGIAVAGRGNRMLGL